MKSRLIFLPVSCRIFPTPSILVGALFAKRVDYSHGFSTVCFFDTSDVIKIVVPNVIQNPKLYLLVQGTEPKSFRFSAYHTIPGQTKVSHISLFSALCNFLKTFFSKGPPSFFWYFAAEWMLETPCDVIQTQQTQKAYYINFKVWWWNKDRTFNQ